MLTISFFTIIGCGASEEKISSDEEPSAEPSENVVIEPTEEPEEPTAEPSEELQDLDGDGVVVDDDCDDNHPNPSDTANDHDCDGVSTEDDCNDNDASDSSLLGDYDGDGIVSADDCDDFDASIGSQCICWEENVFIVKYFTYEEPRVSWTWGYDSNGFLYVFHVKNIAEWGTTEFDFTYDDMGNLLTKEVVHDDDSDGGNEYTASCTYT